MSILQFSNNLYMQPLTQGEIQKLGTFKVAESLELEHIRVQTFLFNLIPTTQKIRLKIFSESTYTALLYTSDWFDLSNIPCTSNWLGYARIDFNGENINKELTYYVGIETLNYTFSESSYLALSYDFPWPVYDNGQSSFTDHPLTMQIFGKK